MAILESRISTGVSWVGESIALFKQAPRKWLLLAVVYVGLFVILPLLLGVLFKLMALLVLPVFTVVAVRMYRNAELQKQESLPSIMDVIQPQMKSLIILGLIGLVYSVVASFVFSADMQEITQLVQNKEKMNEQEVAAAARLIVPFMFKIMLLLTPLVMATWFAPMLIAFNHYSLVKAIKSSIAGSLQHIVAMGVAWLLLSAGVIMLMLLLAIFAVIAAAASPALSSFLMVNIVFGCVLLSTALMLAFQYVSYRDIFRAVL